MTTQTKAKRVEKDNGKTQLEKLVARAIAAKKIINAFEEENEDILAKYKHMNEDLIGINELIKVEARKKAVLGETVVIADNQHIHVSVQGKQTRMFDIAKAEATWDEAIFDAATVMVIDAKVVDSLVASGKLNEKDLSKVQSFVPATAAVTIRLT